MKVGYNLSIPTTREEDSAKIHAIHVTIDHHNSEIERLKSLIIREQQNKLKNEADRITQSIINSAASMTHHHQGFNPYITSFGAPASGSGSGSDDDGYWLEEDGGDDDDYHGYSTPEILNPVKQYSGSEIDLLEVMNQSPSSLNSNKNTDINPTVRTTVPAVFSRSTSSKRSKPSPQSKFSTIEELITHSLWSTAPLEDKTRIALVRAFIGRSMPPVSQWTRDPSKSLKNATRGGGGQPNRKYSRTNYSKIFLETISNISQLLSRTSTRVYRIRIDPRDGNQTILIPGSSEFIPNTTTPSSSPPPPQPQPIQNEEDTSLLMATESPDTSESLMKTLLDNDVTQRNSSLSSSSSSSRLSGVPETVVRIPSDYRCVGCRRYFKTQDPKLCKNMAFHVCDGDEFRNSSCTEWKASHCMDCRVIQWCLKMVPASIIDKTSDEITSNSNNLVDKALCLDAQNTLFKIECSGNSCHAKWSLEDLFVLSMYRTDKDQQYATAKTKKKREQKRLKKMKERNLAKNVPVKTESILIAEAMLFK